MNTHLQKINSAPNPFLLHGKSKYSVQPKLTINTPGDIYEQEADAMADLVMRMSSNEVTKPITGLIGKSVQRKCAHCEEEEKRRKPIMRKTGAGNPRMSVSSSFAASLNASKGVGSSLPQETMSFMENAFSADFSEVRLHTDSKASEMSKGINAKAFTYGNDIFFKNGEYSPYSENGRKLLAHELTHVVQQGDVYLKSLQRKPGSPAGGCGLCFGSPKNVGRLAHRYGQAIMQSIYPFLFTEFPFDLLPSPTDISNPTDDSGRLDLINVVSDDEIEIAEIKPDNAKGYSDGESDLTWYTSELMKFGVKVSRLDLSPLSSIRLFPTLSPVPGCDLQTFYLNEPVNGVYTYYCDPDYADLWKMGCSCQLPTPPVRVPVPHTVPVTAPQKSPVKTAAKAAAGVGAAYLTYRAIRMVPSLLPPLWWTIPANAATP